MLSVGWWVKSRGVAAVLVAGGVGMASIGCSDGGSSPPPNPTGGAHGGAAGSSAAGASGHGKGGANSAGRGGMTATGGTEAQAGSAPVGGTSGSGGTTATGAGGMLVTGGAGGTITTAGAAGHDAAGGTTGGSNATAGTANSSSGGLGGAAGEAGQGGEIGTGGASAGSSGSGSGGDAGTSNTGSGGALANGGGSGTGGSAGSAGTDGSAGSLTNGGTSGSGTGGSVGSGGTGGSAGGPQEGDTRACCRGGTQTYSSGAWGTCQGATVTAEVCDGLDDDCDGQVDNLGSVTCGIGACTTTVAACANGAVGACVPGTAAAGPDGCDGIDNDCDGAVDEDCTVCLHVAPDGDDTAAVGNDGSTPFQTVQVALDFADTHRNVATRVCVAPGAACGASATFNGPNGVLTMHDGINLYGGYESTAWTRCTNSTTTLAPQTGAGVVFPAAVTHQTVLDGFTVTRFADANQTTAVTVDGAHGAVLSNLVVPVGPGTVNSYGVNVIDGAEALIWQSRIDGGSTGIITGEAVGVRAVGSQVLMEDNCPSAPNATGQCATTCSSTGPQITLTYALSSPGSGVTRVNAVLLQDSPGSRIDRSAVCSTLSSFSSLAPNNAGIDVEGDATDTVIRASSVRSGQAYDGGSALKAAILLGACNGATPWLVDNATISVAPTSAQGSTGWEAIHAAGDCHPIIEANTLVSAAPANWSSQSTATSIHCAEAAGVASRCVVERNNVSTVFGPQSAGGGSIGGATTLTGTGIQCDGASCSLIEGNTVIGASDNFYFSSSAMNSLYGTGLVLSSPALVSNNVIYGIKNGGHCTVVGTGAQVGGQARLENNRIRGFDQAYNCSAGIQSSVGLEASGALDVHSNYIAAVDSGCFGSGAYHSLGVDNGGTADYRNNILVGGDCGQAFKEAGTNSDPALFEHNALNPMAYVDEGTTTLTSASAVDQLTDTTASGTLAGACAATADRHLIAGSLCIDAGTTEGAPEFDMDGQARDSKPDIGPDEYVP